MTYHHIQAAAMLSLKEREQRDILMASEEEKVAL
jgi:hypothetical protein